MIIYKIWINSKYIIDCDGVVKTLTANSFTAIDLKLLFNYIIYIYITIKVPTTFIKTYFFKLFKFT